MASIRKAGPREFGISFGLAGPGGSGKTMTALMMIKAFCGDRPMGLIDTESGRGERYYKHFDYLYLELDPPYSPDRYIEAMVELQKAGVAGMVIDSGSHEWAGEGGVLEMHARETGGKDSMNMVGWARVKPRHRRFIEFAKNNQLHVGITFRAVEKSKPNPNPKGKDDKILSLGYRPVTNEEASFEFDLFAMLAAGHEGMIAEDGNCKTFIEFKECWKKGLQITPAVCAALVKEHAKMCHGAPKDDVRIEDGTTTNKRGGLQARLAEIADATTLEEVAAVEDLLDTHRMSLKPPQIEALNQAIAKAKARINGKGTSRADRYAERIEAGEDLDQIAAEMDNDSALSDGEASYLFRLIYNRQSGDLP